MPTGCAQRRDLRLVLWGYFDESGKFADSDFVCVCGYLGGDDNWNSLCSEWGQRLARCGWQAVHTRNVKWKDPSEVAALQAFVGPIRTHVFAGFGIAVDAAYFRRMPIEKRRLLGDKDARDFTFHRLLRIVRDCLKQWGKDDWLSLTFDYEEGFSVQCLKSLIKLRKERDYIKALVKHIGFGDSSTFHPLQAADLFAYGYKRFLQGDPRGAYWADLTKPSTSDNPAPPCSVEFFDADTLEKTVEELRSGC